MFQEYILIFLVLLLQDDRTHLERIIGILTHHDDDYKTILMAVKANLAYFEVMNSLPALEFAQLLNTPMQKEVFSILILSSVIYREVLLCERREEVFKYIGLCYPESTGQNQHLKAQFEILKDLCGFIFEEKFHPIILLYISCNVPNLQFLEAFFLMIERL